MGDMGDYWRDVTPALKQRSQEKRASNRASSADMLTARGVKFAAHNAGAHLVVSADGHTVDFWPGTGKWMTRGFKFGLVGRGVHRLLAHLEQYGGLSKQKEPTK